ncbi:uncharacterized protein (TIGR00162 family) [Methanohalophilus levihalophilus]|uniref:proteasome assembly chaperone family protein n=1 Tax=Methanohalophilus levihalophilus TaxID=1431282 RepID=UPI001AE89724|nr:proteasome assembly chaperone family protein [Methanohalophilus levihalophilus]MBP2030867.1 uncharacterized protein (TIGR00162 family) [Methanohalophilus levihalophilus]
MQSTKVNQLKKDVKLDNPILLVGLPGVGHVGKLVVDHIVETFEAEKLVEIFSPSFPPQVLVDEKSTVRLVSNSFYTCKAGNHDLLLLAGDQQSATTEGHYELCDLYLDIAEEYGVSKIYTLGGFPTGQLEHKDEVMGAVNNVGLVEDLEKHGVIFKENEPGGGIVGVSGLMLGLSQFRDIDAACLMGLTSGYMVDPKSAQSLIKVLSSMLEIEIDVNELEKRAREMEKIVANLMDQKQQQQQMLPDTTPDEDLRYIG